MIHPEEGMPLKDLVESIYQLNDKQSLIESLTRMAKQLLEIHESDTHDKIMTIIESMKTMTEPDETKKAIKEVMTMFVDNFIESADFLSKSTGPISTKKH